MSDWILFIIGLAIALAFSFILNTFFLGSFVAGMKRYLLGRIVGGTIRNTRIDHEATHRTLGLFGLQTRNGDQATRKSIACVPSAGRKY